MTKTNWVFLKLSSGQRVKIDREDLPRIEKHTWRVTVGASGRLRVVTSVRKEDKVRNITLGAFLMKPGKGKQVYPRRFNEALDYRKENLIVCTVAERQRLLPKNRHKQSSKYRGVSFLKAEKKWRAGIQVKGKSINLGNFKSEDDAARAYNKAALHYFADSAYQNPVNRKKRPRKE
jgi:AP2-like factor, euAP2 lineage